MKYLFRILFAAIACAGFAPGGETITHDCSFSAPALTAVADGYTQIAVRDCSVSPQPGAPQLPFRTVRLLLPPGGSIRSITAEPLSGPTVLAGTWKIDFGRTPRSPVSVFDGEENPDPAIYNSTNIFPASAVEQVSVQRMDGYDIAILRVFPVRYAPEPGSLLFTSDLRITVFLNTSDTAESLSDSAAASTPPDGVRARVSAFIDNPETLAVSTSSPRLFAADEISSEDESPPDYDYLLVSSAELMPYFQPLVDLKIAQGLAVKTETMANIVTNYTGTDSAEKLRKFIRDAHSAWGVQYVLLGGDQNVVPHRGVYGYSASETDTAIPSDLYFACLDGSWNHDGDSRWGEPDDGESGGDVDLIAEVYVGRAPVATPAEVENFVAKTIASQTVPPGNFRAVFAAEYLDSLAQGGDALDYILPSFSNSRCRTEWLDDRPQNVSTWTASNIISVLSRSPLFVAHSGHADFDTVMRLQRDDIDALTNQFPFLLYSTGCDAGWFDNFYLSDDSIGEETIKRNLHGAFSAVLNSRLGWYDVQNEWKYSGEFQTEFFKEILRAGRSVIGKADRLSREALIGSVETSGSMPYRWCYFDLILFGDPHAAVEVPVTLTLPSINSAVTNCVVEWNSFTNNCALYRTTDLASQAWACIASNIAPTPPLNTWTNNTSGLDRAFYRVIGE